MKKHISYFERRKYPFSSIKKYKEREGNEIVYAMKINNEMIALNGEDIGTTNDFIMKKGDYLFKPIHSSNKMKYISKTKFKKKYKRILLIPLK